MLYKSLYFSIQNLMSFSPSLVFLRFFKVFSKNKLKKNN
jgi:hypothetical protein